MTDWTPNTAHVRDAYVRQMRNAFVASTWEHEAEFDRWLKAERHEAWVSGWAVGARGEHVTTSPYMEATDD